MIGVLPLRLVLDFAAIGLIIACLAYWWLDNLSHELFGTALFLLIIAHNVFNRRWYGGVTKRKMDAVRAVNLATIACLAVGMAVMLITSLLISRDLFPFTALDAAFAVREIHMFAAYWVLAIVAVHLGTRWQVVMAICRDMFGLSANNVWRPMALRLLTAAVSAWGVKSIVAMGLASKLMLTYSLDMWDFNEATVAFFVNYGSVVCLFAAATHYGLIVLRARRRSIR